MRRLTWMLDRLFRASAIIGAIGLVLIACMVTADVTTRWLTGRPIVGVFEVTTVVLVLVTFFPLALVQFRNQQLRVDIVAEHVKGRGRAMLDLVDAAAGLCVFGLLLWAASEEFVKAYEGGFLLRGMIVIPTAIPVGMILFGTFLMILALVHRAAQAFLLFVHSSDDGSAETRDLRSSD